MDGIRNFDLKSKEFSFTLINDLVLVENIGDYSLGEDIKLSEYGTNNYIVGTIDQVKKEGNKFSIRILKWYSYIEHRGGFFSTKRNEITHYLYLSNENYWYVKNNLEIFDCPYLLEFKIGSRTVVINTDDDVIENLDYIITSVSYSRNDRNHIDLTFEV